MSQQNAKKFIDQLRSDKTMQERTAGMKPEEVLAFAREQGMECTLEELKEETLKSREMSLDEMDQVAGGGAFHLGRKIHSDSDKPACPSSPDGNHKWVKTGEYKVDTLLFLEGWDVFYTCEYCMKTKKEDETGWAW